MPVAVDHRNHVGGILGDECKKLVTLRQLPPNSLQLQMLINGVDVEQQYEAGQRAHPLLEIKPVSAIRSQVRAGEAERHDTGCQHQRDGHGKSPEPPLAALPPAASGSESCSSGCFLFCSIPPRSVMHSTEILD